MIQRVLVALLCASVCAGCGSGESSPVVEPDAEHTLLIGLIPEQNIFKQIERYEPLAAYLSRRAGVKFELRVLPRYGNIIDNFVSTGLDGAFFGSFTYALAHEKIGVEVLARPVGRDGSSSYHGLIFIRRDSGLNGIRGLRGKRFAFVDKATTAGYLLPLEFFHVNGIEDYPTFFSETYFAGTHENSIYDVLSGGADIGAAKSTVFGRLAAADPRIANELLILTRSPDVPENGLALRPDIDPEVRNRIKQTLLEMKQDPEGRQVLVEFGALEFIETTSEDYAPVYRYAEEVGLDLATYDYIND